MSQEDRVFLLQGVAAYNDRSEPFPPTGNRLVSSKLEKLQEEGHLKIQWVRGGAFCWITDQGREVLDAVLQG